jgi:hypothetical protein
MSSTRSAHRTVLEGVPRAGYDIHMCPFPGSLYACLQYLGDPQDYDYLMGITGAAFRRFWNRDDGGNVDLSYLGDEPFRRVFEALGYDWYAVPADKEAMLAAIRESIGRGVPAISFGIIGPPEAGIVTGYDPATRALYGWSCFQETRAQYYEKSDWFETMDVPAAARPDAGRGLIVIGAKRPSRPTERGVLVSSLEWAIDLERTASRASRPDHICGLAAYDAWAGGLEVDADYPANDPQALGTRVMVHGDQTVMLEERHSAARYLRQMAKNVPAAAAEHLNAAAALYDQVADRVSDVWLWGASMGQDAQQGLADPQNRRAFAGHLRAAKAQEAQAVEHLERALAELR